MKLECVLVGNPTRQSLQIAVITSEVVEKPSHLTLQIRPEGGAWKSIGGKFFGTPARRDRQHVRFSCEDFARPHGALKFGRETRTPAMQAGLATRRLTFREVFVCLPPSLLVSIGAITCAVPSRLPTAPIVDELLAA